MRIYNGITVTQTVKYHGIRPCTAKQFHAALEREYEQTLKNEHYHLIKAERGNSCEVKYDYQTNMYVVDHFYSSYLKRKNQAWQY